MDVTIFSPFWPSVSPRYPPNRVLVSAEEIYGILMLALPILGLKELGVAIEMPLLFCS